jgi:hypothetical protein
MPSERGELENPKKSAFSLEYYDSSWELEYMQELEKPDNDVVKWTKNHGIRIPYFDDDGKYRTYKPDFLVEKKDGTVELHEMKGGHLLQNPITKRKIDAAREWCKVRKMNLKLLSKF